MNATVEKYGKYDSAFVAGILYHLDNPHIFLNLLQGRTLTPNGKKAYIKRSG